MSLTSKIALPYSISTVAVMASSVAAHAISGAQSPTVKILTGIALAMSIIGAFGAISLTFGTCFGGCEDGEGKDPVCKVGNGILLGTVSAFCLAVLFFKAIVS